MSAVVTELNAETYKELLANSDDLYIVDFWAQWCGPCKVMGPFFEKAAGLEKYQDVLKFAKVNTDENQDLAVSYKITGIPCFVFIKFDKEAGEAKEVARIVGASDFISFVDNIDENLKQIQAQ